MNKIDAHKHEQAKMMHKSILKESVAVDAENRKNE